MKYGCPSPKRLLLRSNWKHICHMDLGKLPQAERLRLTAVQTTRLQLSWMGRAWSCIDIACDMFKVAKVRAGAEQKTSEPLSWELMGAFLRHIACMPIEKIIHVQGLSSSFWTTSCPTMVWSWRRRTAVAEDSFFYLIELKLMHENSCMHGIL